MSIVLLPLVLYILGPVQNKGLPLATGAFRSSPVASLYVESNILPQDLYKEFLVVKALLRSYFLPFSPLQFLLASEDLDNSSWKFALLVHPRLLGEGIVDFNVLEFKFTGVPPWTFPSFPICLFLSYFLSYVFLL